MKKISWVLAAVILMTGVLWADSDPYPNWTTDQLKAEIVKLKKQIGDLQQKTNGTSAASKNDNGYGSAAPAGKDGIVLVDDFETDHPSFGGGWWEGCDQNKMGTTISPDPYARLKGGSPKSPGFCAGMKGHLGPNEAPWPWATLTLGMGDNGASTDLTAYKAVRFYTMGDGKTHTISLQKLAVKDYADFKAEFTAPKGWTQVSIPFDKFSQPDWGAKVEKKFEDVKALSFAPGLNDADYDFKIDDVEFLK